MDQQDIQKKCEEFLKSLGIPGFIVFGWKKAESEFGLVYSTSECPPQVVVKGLAGVMHEFSNLL